MPVTSSQAGLTTHLPPLLRSLMEKSTSKVEAFLNHKWVTWKRKRFLQWLVRWKGFGETYDKYEFDDDLKEDLSADFYNKLRAEFEQAAKIPAGAMPPDDGRAPHSLTEITQPTQQEQADCPSRSAD